MLCHFLCVQIQVINFSETPLRVSELPVYNFVYVSNDSCVYIIGAPLKPKTPLVFCNYNGSSCCDSIQDKNIQKQFESMNVSQPACASLLKSILCSVSFLVITT